MLQEQNDVGLVIETKAEKVVDKPCIKRLMEEGISGEYRKDAMTEIAKACYRREISREESSAILTECNSRNVPPLLDGEISRIIYTVYTNGYADIACGEKLLRPYCDKKPCRANGSTVTVMPPSVKPIAPAAVLLPVKASAPSPVAVMSTPSPDITVTALSILTDDPIENTSFQSDRRIIPSDCLPEGWPKDYIKFACPLTEAPSEYHFATALAIVATVMGRNVFLREGHSIYYCNLYQLVLGESALYRKSTALDLCKEFLPAINEDYILGEMMSLEGFLDAFRSCPVRLIVYDELMKLTISEGKSYGRGLMAEFTTLWQCPPVLKIGLKKLKPDERIIREPTLSILAATTPAWLNIKERDIHGGFWGRFVPMYASGDRRSLPIRPPMDEVQKDHLLQRLKVISGISAEYTWQEDAAKCFSEIYRNLGDALEKKPNKELIGSYWGRIGVHIKKLAMIFDACSPAPTFTITKDNVIRAKVIMEHATFCYREMLKSAFLNQIDKAEQKFLELLRKAYPEWLQHSMIMRDGNFKANIMNKAIANLYEKDEIEIKTEPSERKPRHLYRLRKQ